MSSASMVALAVEGHKPSFAYIVTKMRSQYFKKATGSTTFTCNDGDKIFSAVNKALKTKEGVEIEAKSTGTLEDGTIVSEFHFTWSIKQRKIWNYQKIRNIVFVLAVWVKPFLFVIIAIENTTLKIIQTTSHWKLLLIVMLMLK